MYRCRMHLNNIASDNFILLTMHIHISYKNVAVAENLLGCISSLCLSFFIFIIF